MSSNKGKANRGLVRDYLAANPMFSPKPKSRAVKKVKKAFSENLSAGKNTYVYDAHTYHTKVPPEGIEVLIDYYTETGDTVLDFFCGSGMTGIAARRRGRKALFSDLSPAAAFIAYNLNHPVDAEQYLRATQQLITGSRDLSEKLYQTTCRECAKRTAILYTVWSYGLICHKCGGEFKLWDIARDEKPIVRESKIKPEFDCPHCGQNLVKRQLARTKRYPVALGYKCCSKGTKERRVELTAEDHKLIKEIESVPLPADLWFPTAKFPDGVNTRQAIKAGIDSVDKAYTRRSLIVMATLWKLATEWEDEAMRDKLLFTLTSLYQRVTVFSEFRFWGGSGNIANYNVPALMNEQNVFLAFERKAKTIAAYFKNEQPVDDIDVVVSTQSATSLPTIPDKSIDYIFVDPPFGSNINYSEMNFLWESWLGTYTDPTEEAIVNRVQHKTLEDYENLLLKAFLEAKRVLKDDGWITIVFHNSSAKVWAALQRVVEKAGFDILGTQTFDKKHGTFKMFVSDNAVGYDLVLHCQKNQTLKKLEIFDVNEEESLLTFMREELGARSSEYVSKFLHVKRDDEFDYRKLYAKWLSQALQYGKINTDFESFRKVADLVIKEGVK